MLEIIRALLTIITVTSVLSINQNINPSVYMGRSGKLNFSIVVNPAVAAVESNYKVNYDLSKTDNLRNQNTPRNRLGERKNNINSALSNEVFKINKTHDINRFKRNNSSAVQAINQSEPFIQKIKSNVTKTQFQSRNDDKDGYSYTTAEEFPYAVRIKLKYKYDIPTLFSFRCSGTLLTPNWVLTAAHCVAGKLVDPNKVLIITVQAGITNESSAEQVSKVQNFLVHPKYKYNYQTNKLRYDIALLGLNTTFQLTKTVQTIALSKTPWKFGDVDDCTITTFSHGHTNPYVGPDVIFDRKRTTNYLKATSPCKKCPEAEANKKFMMCSKPKLVEYGLCMGAGGGALVCNGVVVAVASGVVLGEFPGLCDPEEEGIMTDCSTPSLYRNSMALFVQTYPYIDWINSHTDIEDDKPLTTYYWPTPSSANSYSLYLPCFILCALFLNHAIN